MGREELEQNVTKKTFFLCDSHKACLHKKGTEKAPVSFIFLPKQFILQLPLKFKLEHKFFSFFLMNMFYFNDVPYVTVFLTLQIPMALATLNCLINGSNNDTVPKARQFVKQFQRQKNFFRRLIKLIQPRNKLAIGLMRPLNKLIY